MGPWKLIKIPMHSTEVALSSNPIWRDRNGQRVELEKGGGNASAEKHLPKRAVDLCETLVNLE